MLLFWMRFNYFFIRFKFFINIKRILWLSYPLDKCSTTQRKQLWRSSFQRQQLGANPRHHGSGAGDHQWCGLIKACIASHKSRYEPFLKRGTWLKPGVQSKGRWWSCTLLALPCNGLFRISRSSSVRWSCARSLSISLLAAISFVACCSDLSGLIAFTYL